MQKTISAPKVTILCFTYNQKKFIGDALEGFEKQTIFDDCEVLIHDDCSSDDTIELIEEFKTKYPGKVQIFKEKTNRFSKGDYGFFADMFRYARGRYITWCEGDDYWTDAYKLQKQIEILDANKSFGLCFHPVKIIFDDGRPAETYPIMPVEDFNVDYLYKMNFMQTNSVMYRKRDYKTLGTNFLPIDWYMHAYHLKGKNNKIGFIRDVMSVYRVNKNGVWYESHLDIESFWEKQWRNHITFYEALSKIAVNRTQKDNINRNEYLLINSLQKLKNGEKIMKELANEYSGVLVKYARLLYIEFNNLNEIIDKMEPISFKNYLLVITAKLKNIININ